MAQKKKKKKLNKKKTKMTKTKKAVSGKKKATKAKKKKTKKKSKKAASKKKVAKKKTTAKKKVAKKAAKTKPSKKASSKVSRLTKRASTPASPGGMAPATMNSVNVGDLAPDFTLTDQNGTTVSLSQFRGKKVVLYFYPKDDTPGCTREACSFRDHLSQFEGLNAEIIGISFDDQQSHQKFIEKYGLNFTLLSDVEKEVASKYGVYVQKNMYGKTYMGIERSTFVIDTEGRVSQTFRNVKVDGHTNEVIVALEEAA